MQHLKKHSNTPRFGHLKIYHQINVADVSIIKWEKERLHATLETPRITKNLIQLQADQKIVTILQSYTPMGIWSCLIHSQFVEFLNTLYTLSGSFQIPFEGFILTWKCVRPRNNVQLCSHIPKNYESSWWGCSGAMVQWLVDFHWIKRT